MKNTNRPLDELTPEEIIEQMDKADLRAVKAVESARNSIARAASEAAVSIGAGGRLIYVGAGTSGRLGVLDASECPPTFSAKPGQVIGVIAGGKKALYRSIEGAEDNERAGRGAVARLRVGAKDMIVGISASGTAPYVLAALDEAAGRGAKVWLVTCAPQPHPHPTLPHRRGRETHFIPSPLVGEGLGRGGINVILLDTGPEVIQGSTRLAAGTATKLALNRISTACFVMLGKVYGDLMVDVMPTNAKLVKRATGIITKLTGCKEDEAARLLKKSGGSAKVAIVMKIKGLTKVGAERLLKEKGGFLRAALKDASKDF